MAPLHGVPLAVHAARVLAAARDAGTLAEAFAVVRGPGALADALAREGLAPVEAPDAERGMAHSLAAGLAAVEAAFPAGPAAALVALADQPDTPPEAVARLAAWWQVHGDPVVRPRYAGAPDEPGHPVLLDRATWPLVRALAGDTGLAPALREAGVPVTLVDLPGRNPDIDTPADYAARLTNQETD
jgi:CTP:molybdopterin cytidylyltransferase MocA